MESSSSRIVIDLTGAPPEALENRGESLRLKRKHDEDAARDEESKRSRVAGEDSGQIDNRAGKGQCLRIQNVPLAWSKDELLACLQTAHTSLNNLDAGALELYPACSSSLSQTALLNTKEPLAYFESLKLKQPKYIPVNDPALRNACLEVDSHFAALTPLNMPEGNIIADIIAVTGLAGHPYGSWRNRATRAMWLQDFLPNERGCKNFRILTYGYNTQLIGGDTVDDTFLDYGRDFIQQLENARVSDEERRRHIIFIGHSLGGIMVLKALAQAKNNHHHKDILDSTKAILFFGTPHAGLETSQLINMVSDMSGVEEPSSRLKLLQHLTCNSEFLLDLRDELTEIWGALQVFSFYETKKTPTVGQESTTGAWGRFGKEVKLVQAFSALLHLPQERQIPVSRNHSDMVKFGSAADKDYRTVVTCIKEIATLCGKKRAEIMRWISDIPFQDHHAFERKKRHQDTGYWLMENEKYRTWRSLSSSMIWLRGDAGSGKTILASKIIDEFKLSTKQHWPSTKQEALAYFYCNYREEARRDPTLIFRTLVKQLCLVDRKKKGGLPESVLSIYRNQDDGSGPPDLNRSTDLIVKLSARFSQTTIIIDALDECNRETRIDLFRMLKNILSSTTHIRIFLTGRCDGDIHQMLDGFPSHYIEARDNTRDIKTYINAEIERCYQERQILDLEFKSEIISALVNGANGMFIWVHFQILAICATGRVRDTLATLPRGMDKTYHQILERIAGLEGLSTPGTAHTILMWILCAKENRSLALITEVLSIKPGENVRDSEKWTLSMILNICQNLVVYDEKLETLWFAHFSVQEFLQRQPEFNKETVHTCIAEVCLTALLYHFDELTALGHRYWDVGSDSDVESDSDVGSDSGLDCYATRNWGAHLYLSSSESEMLKGLWKAFLKPSPAYTAWGSKMALSKDNTGGVLTPVSVACSYKLYDVLKFLLGGGANASGSNSHVQTPLSIAAECGFTGGVQLLIGVPRINLNPLDEDSCTPVNIAAYEGHEKVVQLLLGAPGVDLNTPNKYGRTPVNNAVCRGHEKVVQLLLEASVDLNAPDKYGRTPVNNAAFGGHEKVLKLLLGAPGVDLNTLNKYDRTPVNNNVCRGHEKVQQLLLEASVDLNTPDGNGRTPVNNAAFGGYEKVLQLLLEASGVDLNTSDINGHTPVNNAARRGHEKVMQLLLGASVDLNTPDINGHTPVNNAARRGHEKVLQLLMGASVDLNTPDKYGYTPVNSAAYEGHEKVLQLLLEASGVDLNMPDVDGRTPVNNAACRGHEKVLQLLLEASGVDLNTPDIYGCTPLWNSTWLGYEMIARGLLERGGVDLNSRDGGGMTPLSVAVQHNRQEVVQILVNRDGVNLNSRDQYGQTPLSYAAYTGYERVMELLLQNDQVDLNSQDQTARTPLFLAAQFNRLTVMRMLLDKEGVVFDCPDIYGQTPLLYAAGHGYVEVVQMLLDTGRVNVNSRDNHGKDPIYWASWGGHDRIIAMLQEHTPRSSAIMTTQVDNYPY